MKKKIPLLFDTIMAEGICISCKKETSCEGCRENNNHQSPFYGLTRKSLYQPIAFHSPQRSGWEDK